MFFSIRAPQNPQGLKSPFLGSLRQISSPTIFNRFCWNLLGNLRRLYCIRVRLRVSIEPTGGGFQAPTNVNFGCSQTYNLYSILMKYIYTGCTLYKKPSPRKRFVKNLFFNQFKQNFIYSLLTYSTSFLVIFMKK